MTYRIELTPRAANDLKKLDNSVRKVIIKTLERLSVDPEIGKPLEYEFNNLRSYRAGSYRVIYSIYKKEIHVIVVAIGHRRDVYERLRKLLNR